MVGPHAQVSPMLGSRVLLDEQIRCQRLSISAPTGPSVQFIVVPPATFREVQLLVARIAFLKQLKLC